MAQTPGAHSCLGGPNVSTLQPVSLFTDNRGRVLRSLSGPGQTQLQLEFFACLKNIFHCFEFDENVFSH